MNKQKRWRPKERDEVELIATNAGSPKKNRIGVILRKDMQGYDVRITKGERKGFVAFRYYQQLKLLKLREKESKS